jgi:hypothetical protein
MAVVAQEKMLSRKITRGVSAEINYTITGTDTYTDALSAMIDQHEFDGRPGLNLGISGLLVKNIRYEPSVDPVFVDTVTPANSIWDGTIRYYLATTSRKSNETDEVPATWRFNTGGTTRHITQSFSTLVTPGDAPELNGAIEYDGKKVNGTDIFVPDFRFSIGVVLTAAEFPLTTMATMAEVAGKLNNAEFQGFAAKTVLYLNTEGTQDQKTGNWTLQHNFAYKPIMPSGTTIGGITTTAAIPGWYYTWIKYEEDVTDSLMLKKPIAVYSEQVYEEADFSTLPGLS